MKRFKDVIVGSIVIAFGVFYFSQTQNIRKIPFIDPIVGSAMFPRIIAVIMVICGLAILIQGLRSLGKTESKSPEVDKSIMEKADEAENGTPETEATARNGKGGLKVVLVLLNFALYAFFMDKIGFAFASFLYLFSQMILMSHEKQSVKQMIIYLVLSAVISAAVFALFRYGFGLLLPKANWF